TTATFEQEVIDASKTQPVVVDFWAPWCGPCRMLTPIIEKVARDFAGRVKVVKVNSDENPELAAAYGIRSIPNVIAFKDGRPAAQFVGALPESQVRVFVEKLLPSAAEQALARAEALYAANRIAEAERVLATVQREPGLEQRISALQQGIAYAKAPTEGPSEKELHERLDADPGDHEARLALASLYAGQRRFAEAMEE